MNLFSDTLLRNTVQYMSSPIVLNPNSDDEYTVHGFITNATLSPNSSYHLHTVNEFMRGDYLLMNDDNDYYIVIGDVVEERGSKYKSTLDFCNYKNEIIETIETDEIIGYLGNGRPIWKKETVVVGFFVGTIRHKEVAIGNNQVITIANTDVILTLKDTPKAREFYTVNKEFMYEGKKWKVIEVNLLKRGLLELKLMSVLL